jgi:hypothetical protein
VKNIAFIFLACIFLGSFLQAQPNIVKNVKFGFNLGSNYSALNIERSNSTVPGEIIQYNGLGFRIGIVAEYVFNERFSFVPKYEMSFNETGLLVKNTSGEQQNLQIYPVTMELNPHFNFNLKNGRCKPYVLFGSSIKIPVTKNYDPYYSPVKTTAVCIDLGFGINKALEYFNFSPELRYSYGLNNISNVEGIKNMHFHCVTIVVNIKG